MCIRDRCRNVELGVYIENSAINFNDKGTEGDRKEGERDRMGGEIIGGEVGKYGEGGEKTRGKRSCMPPGGIYPHEVYYKALESGELYLVK